MNNQLIMYRALPVRGSSLNVDRENGVIRNVSAMQIGEALGHNVNIDMRTLQMLVALDEGKGNKVRLSHPGMCEDGMARRLGRFTDPRIVDDKVVGNLVFSRAAYDGPNGNMADYVMTLAEEDPESFGLSVVVAQQQVALNADGSETIVPRGAEVEGQALYMRPMEWRATDVVDEPAANRDGLFAAIDFQGGGADAIEAFAQIDAFIEYNGLTVEKAQEFTARYFDARLNKSPAGENPALTKGDVAMTDKQQITPAELAELSDANGDHRKLITDMFAAGNSRQEIETALAEAKTDLLLERNKALADANTQLSADLEKVEAERDEAVAKFNELKGVATAATDPGDDDVAGGDVRTIHHTELANLSKEDLKLWSEGKIKVDYSAK